MKINIFQISILALVIFFITSCAPDISDVNGNRIWLENECFEANDNYWHIKGPRCALIHLQRVPLPGSEDFIGPAIHCNFTLFNWPEGGAPELGTYSCSSEHPDSSDQVFLAGVSRYEIFNHSHFSVDTTQLNTFEISNVYGNSFSGKVSCHFYNIECPTEKKWLKASFENILYK